MHRQIYRCFFIHNKILCGGGTCSYVYDVYVTCNVEQLRTQFQKEEKSLASHSKFETENRIFIIEISLPAILKQVARSEHNEWTTGTKRNARRKLIVDLILSLTLRNDVTLFVCPVIYRPRISFRAAVKWYPLAFVSANQLILCKKEKENWKMTAYLVLLWAGETWWRFGFLLSFNHWTMRSQLNVFCTHLNVNHWRNWMKWGSIAKDNWRRKNERKRKKNNWEFDGLNIDRNKNKVERSTAA